MKESPKFRIMYGWAVDRYRTNKYLGVGKVNFSLLHCCFCVNPNVWEIFNAFIKGMMAVASVTMYEGNQGLVQSTTIGVSLALHLFVQPYKHKLENVVVILFYIVDLLGINSGNGIDVQILFKL